MRRANDFASPSEFPGHLTLAALLGRYSTSLAPRLHPKGRVRHRAAATRAIAFRVTLPTLLSHDALTMDRPVCSSPAHATLAPSHSSPLDEALRVSSNFGPSWSEGTPCDLSGSGLCNRPCH